MVTPALLAGTGAAVSGGTSAGFVLHHFWPKGTKETGICGIPDTGKTHLNRFIVTKGQPTYAITTQSTINPGNKIKSKIPGSHGKIQVMDFAGGAATVPQQQNELDPKWWIFALSVDTWWYPSNWSVLHALCNELDSHEYHLAHDPIYRKRWFRNEVVKKRRTGNGCKIITIALNKVDKWSKWDSDTRERECERIAHHYMQVHPNNPLNTVRNSIAIEFIAMSVHKGIYYHHSDLGGDKEFLKDYFVETRGKL